MTSLDTNIVENYLYDATVAKNNLDANNYVVKQRNITPIIDQQKGGEYKTSTVIIDAQSFGNGSDYVSWQEAYITLPYRVTLDLKSGANTNLGIYNPNMLTALKNNCLIDSLKVEQAGRVIINETQNLSHLVNFVKHCTTTQDELNTQTVPNAYYPDSEFSSSITANLQGTVNVSNDAVFNNTIGGVFHQTLFVNNGVIQRQMAMYPLNESNSTAFSNENLQKSEFSVYQKINTPVGNTAISPTNTTISSIHFMAVIYLRDLSDYFSKHVLSKGVGYKLTLKVNQATSILNVTSSTSNPLGAVPSIVSTSLVSGSSAQPAMLTTGIATINSGVAFSTATTAEFTLTSAIDSTSDARSYGVTLYVPSYILSEESESKLLSDPVINRNPFVVNSAVYTNLVAGSPINLQLFSAISNPRALVVIPQFSQSSQGQPSHYSPLNPCPAVTDPCLGLTRIQVRVNSRPVLPNNSNYSYQQFIDYTSRIFKTNGGLSNLTSGVINYSKFTNNYRYYAFDLTQVVEASQRDVPQLITFEGFNNSAVNVDLYVFVLYEQSVTFDVLKGAVEIM